MSLITRLLGRRPIELSQDGQVFLRRCLVTHAEPRTDTSLAERVIVAGGDRISAVNTLRREGLTILFPRTVNRRRLTQGVESVRKTIKDIRSGNLPTAAEPAFRLATSSDSYSSMASSPIPVVSLRTGTDDGMVDIFHGDKLFPDLADEVSKKIEELNVGQVLEEVVGRAMMLTNFNLYINDSVTETRSWHVDSYGNDQFKVFMYLTDVKSLSDGPYCYVLGSSQEKGFEDANRFMAHQIKARTTDVSVFDPRRMLPILAPSGSVVISNQSGAHRGAPQGEGHFRCIAALNFFPSDSDH